MKKCFTKLFALLFVVTETIFSAGSVYGLSYRHAIQMKEQEIRRINDRAISVNTLPEEQLDVTLNGEKVGMRTNGQYWNSFIYAFKDSDINCNNISSLANNILNTDYRNEIILTGYGKGANLAAKVASNMRRMYNWEDPQQVKVIAFCADSEFEDDFSGTYCEPLSCRLHFGKRDRTPPYDTSKMIEFNMSPTITERFSIPKCAIGATALIGTGVQIECVSDTIKE